ncbi:major facilitator superfamily domain-containing protein [Lactarius quietus]|nr:major facilitator superfamily domain-containing protein [Lactarius quietus]
MNGKAPVRRKSLVVRVDLMVCTPAPGHRWGIRWQSSPLLSSPRELGANDEPEAPFPTSPDPVVIHLSRADLLWVLVGLWSPVFLGALDGTIVATLMTPIGNYFNKSNQASYIGTSYLLSVCCFTPLYGRLSDILGRRGAMLLGLTLFGAGTICCGFAPSMEALIAARAVAGMGGGGIMTGDHIIYPSCNLSPTNGHRAVSSVAVTDLVPLKQRGLYQGMANIMFGLGSGIGGPLGGWMNDTFGWRSAFLFQIPILAFSFIIVTLKVSIPISQESLPWSHPLIYGLFITSAAFAVLFVAVEARWAPYPVMPLHLITQRTPLAVCLANFFGSMAALSRWAATDCRGLTQLTMCLKVFICYRTRSAICHMPRGIALSSGSVFAGWIMRRTGKLYTLTLIVMWNEKSSQWHLWVDIVPQGFGMASLITSTLIAVIAGVAKTDVAVATGITYLFRTTGQVLGVSLSGTLLQSILVSKLRQRIHGPNAEESISRIRHSTDVVNSLDPVLRKAAIDSYADALRVVFICQLILNILTLLCCTAIQENPLPGTLKNRSLNIGEILRGKDEHPVSKICIYQASVYNATPSSTWAQTFS